MLTRFYVWLHEKRKGHMVIVRKVSVPLWDRSAKGLFYRCVDCDKTWAL